LFNDIDKLLGLCANGPRPSDDIHSINAPLAGLDPRDQRLLAAKNPRQIGLGYASRFSGVSHGFDQRPVSRRSYCFAQSPHLSFSGWC